MTLYSLASSSSGNAYLYDFGNTKILVDLGINYKTLKNKLEEISIDISHIDALLITHEHTDHVKGCEVFLKNEEVDIYLTKGTKESMKFSFEQYIQIKAGEYFLVNDIQIKPIKTSHDASESIGFLFSYEQKTYGHITDTGYIGIKLQKDLENLHFYLIESNYDEQALLRNKEYPYHVKKRINSDKGHLSNVQTSQYIKKLIGHNTEVICFGHLSEKNNDPELVEILNESLEVSKKYVLLKDEVVTVKCK